MAQEDERKMGVLPTSNQVQLVSKYLYVWRTWRGGVVATLTRVWCVGIPALV